MLLPRLSKYLPAEKAVHTGIPVRDRSSQTAMLKKDAICVLLSSEKPIILIMGGSLGSRAINAAVRAALPRFACLSTRFAICAGRAISTRLFDQTEGYAQFEYVADDLSHLFAAADFIVSRAGATALFELLSLQKACTFDSPFHASQSRRSDRECRGLFEMSVIVSCFQKRGLRPTVLCKAIRDLCDQSDALRQSMSDWRHARRCCGNSLNPRQIV